MFEERYLQGKKMKWYKFQKHFLLPFMCVAFGARAIGGILELIVFRENPEYWIAILDAIFALTSISLIAISTRGMYVREWKGPSCLLAFIVVSFLNTLYDPVILGAYVGEYTQTDASIIGLLCFLAYFVFFLLNFVYYDHRRLYFESWYEPEESLQAEEAGGAETPEEPAAASLPEESAEAISEEPASPAQALPPVSEVPEKKKVRVHIHKASSQAVEDAIAETPEETKEVPKTKNGKVAIIALAALSCALLIATGVSMFFAVRGMRSAGAAENQNAQLQADYATLQEEYESLEDDLESEESEVRKKNAEIRQLNAELETADSDYSTLLEDYAIELSENMFYSYHIGFIINGSRYYHTIDCPIYQSADTYWAHNVEYCESIGYTPCPDCW